MSKNNADQCRLMQLIVTAELPSHHPSTRLVAREDKGRIYQPQPFFNFIIGTQPLLQPLLDFLRLTITLQPWGVGWGGAREDKGRIYQPQPFFNFIIGTQPLLQPLLDFLRLTITLQPWGVGWAGVRLGKIRVGSPSHNLSSTSL